MSLQGTVTSPVGPPHGSSSPTMVWFYLRVNVRGDSKACQLRHKLFHQVSSLLNFLFFPRSSEKVHMSIKISVPYKKVWPHMCIHTHPSEAKTLLQAPPQQSSKILPGRCCIFPELCHHSQQQQQLPLRPQASHPPTQELGGAVQSHSKESAGHSHHFYGKL